MHEPAETTPSFEHACEARPGRFARLRAALFHGTRVLYRYSREIQDPCRSGRKIPAHCSIMKLVAWDSVAASESKCGASPGGSSEFSASLMPANLTPQYLKAEQAFKEAKTTEDKIAALEEMIALLPKHKGTDHLLADLRRRLSKLREEAAKPKGPKKGFDLFRVEKGGAGQVLLLGPPNSGKSAIVARLSNAPTQPTPFPFATQGPIPGMMVFEDTQIQIVDLPPVAAGRAPKGMMGLVKSADGLLLVADLEAETVLDDLEAVLAYLEEGRVSPIDPAVPESERIQEPDPDPDAPKFLRKLRLPSLLLANKIDVPGAREKLELLREYCSGRFVPLAVSAATGEGLQVLPEKAFRMLDCIRVYSKEPGKPPDLKVPFVLKRGSTVLDLAGKIHKDFPEHLREARVWGSSRFGGQAVPKEYVLVDKDVVELHVDL